MPKPVTLTQRVLELEANTLSITDLDSLYARVERIEDRAVAGRSLLGRLRWLFTGE